MNQLSITEARSQLTRLADQLQADQEPVEVTNHGKPVLAILPWDLFEALEETVEILGDEALMARLHKSIHQIEVGKLIPLARIKKKLGLK
jgi:antitoxin YefM